MRLIGLHCLCGKKEKNSAFDQTDTSSGSQRTKLFLHDLLLVMSRIFNVVLSDSLLNPPDWHFHLVQDLHQTACILSQLQQQ